MKTLYERTRCVCVLLAAVFGLVAGFGPAPPAGLYAQEAGSVTGSVTDAQGLALPGAMVVLRTDGRAFVASAVTDRAGRFVLAGIPGGDYVLAASLLGFSTHEEAVTAGGGGRGRRRHARRRVVRAGGDGQCAHARGDADRAGRAGVEDRKARRPGPGALAPEPRGGDCGAARVDQPRSVGPRAVRGADRRLRGRHPHVRGGSGADGFGPEPRQSARPAVVARGARAVCADLGRRHPERDSGRDLQAGVRGGRSPARRTGRLQLREQRRRERRVRQSLRQLRPGPIHVPAQHPGGERLH